jgi:hypothetical protein
MSARPYFNEPERTGISATPGSFLSFSFGVSPDTPGSSLVLGPDGDVCTGKKSPYRAPIAGFTLQKTP